MEGQIKKQLEDLLDELSSIPYAFDSISPKEIKLYDLLLQLEKQVPFSEIQPYYDRLKEINERREQNLWPYH